MSTLTPGIWCHLQHAFGIQLHRLPPQQIIIIINEYTCIIPTHYYYTVYFNESTVLLTNTTNQPTVPLTYPWTASLPMMALAHRPHQGHVEATIDFVQHFGSGDGWLIIIILIVFIGLCALTTLTFSFLRGESSSYPMNADGLT